MVRPERFERPTAGTAKLIQVPKTRGLRSCVTYN